MFQKKGLGSISKIKNRKIVLEESNQSFQVSNSSF